MREKLKKYIAAILSFAMVLTLLPAPVVKAEEAATAGITTIPVNKFVVSGGQGYTGTYLIATNEHGSASGSNVTAAFEQDVTGTEMAGGLGSARVGGLAFALPTDGSIDASSIAEVTLTMNVTGTNENLGARKTKAGLFLVDSSCYDKMVTDEKDNAATTYPAVNQDYSKAATIYSEEWISANNLGTKTFDVTEWVKDSLEAEESHIIFRLQTVLSGFLVTNTGDNAPTLTVLTAEGAVAKVKDDLTLPTTVRSNVLELPSTGDYGTSISWVSDNPAIDTATGNVTRSGEDVYVKLTATITKTGKVVSGNEAQVYTATKDFTVRVSKPPSEDLIAGYDFVASDLTDLTIEDYSLSGKYDATLAGTGATVENGALMLPGGDKGSSAAYVSIPKEVFVGQDTLTITAWLKNQTGDNDTAAMYFGNATPKNYWLLNPNKSGNLKSVWGDGNTTDKPWESETAPSKTPTSDNWAMYTTVITADSITAYYNGEQASTATKTVTTSDMANDIVAYIGRSAFNDIFYKGGVYGVQIYNKALTEDEICTEYYTNRPAGVEQQPLFDAVADTLEKTMLNDNDSKDLVVTALSFPTKKNGISLTWTTNDVNEEIINATTGEIVYEGEELKPVKITVVGTFNEKEVFTRTYDIQVKDALVADFEDIKQRYVNGVKGNVDLPSIGKYGSVITNWTSSNTEVINLEEKANEGYDATPAGVVTRQEEDTTVTLTATFTLGEGENAISKEKSFDVIVKAKNTIDELTDYVMAYFVGDKAGQEKIYLAASQDGLNWTELNDAEVFIESDLGTKGLRDPFIIRSPEGDKFYMIATDLCIGSGTSWSDAQRAGSQAIMVWESEDLVNWSDQRMVTVSAGIEAGCTWAPESFYDEKTGEYIVFWASKVKEDNYAQQRLYYAKTRDFYTFSEPKVWIDMEGTSTIDTTVIRDDDGTYYRFTKNENDKVKRIFMEKSDSMLGEWTSVESASLWAEQYVEGPCAFRFNADDKEKAGAEWCVLLDDFGGIGYYPMVTNDLAADEVEFTQISANLPSVKKPRHGTVLPITSAEYDALMNAYGTPVVNAEVVPSHAPVGYELPTTIEVTLGRETINPTIAWTEAGDFTKAGTTTVKGTVEAGIINGKAYNAVSIEKEIEVVDTTDMIYFIDSGVTESASYNAIAKAVELRNKTADSEYDAKAEDSWGIVGVDTAVGNRASTINSLYENGWWAKSGYNCEYSVPLECGTYEATAYLSEWWWIPGHDNYPNYREMEFYAQYVNDSGNTITVPAVVASVNGDANKQATLVFDVVNVKPGTKADVKLMVAKTGGSDPVISGLSIKKTASGEEREEARANVKAALENVTIDPTEKTLNIKETVMVKPVYPEGFADVLEAADMAEENITVAYDTNNSKVVSLITKNGKATGEVVAKKAGNAVITMTVLLEDGTEKELTTNIKVLADKTALDAAISTAKAKVKADYTAETWTVLQTALAAAEAEFAKEDSAQADVDTATNNLTAAIEGLKPYIAPAPDQGTPDQGTPNPPAQGGATGGATDTAPTEVKVSSIKITNKNVKIAAGKKVTLEAVVGPEDATNSDVEWSIAAKDAKYASVNASTGVVTTKKKGAGKKVTVTATAKDGSGVKATVKVQIMKHAVKSIKLKAAKKQVVAGKKVKIKTTVKTTGKKVNKTLAWTSSNDNWATVSSKGVVSTKKAGKGKTVTITATSTDGTNKKAKVKIKIK